MNTQLSGHFSSGPNYRGRAHFSPVMRRTTQLALTRRGTAHRVDRRRATMPAADTLTPSTPNIAPRLWNPHLLDRLQAPLTRFRD
jgi:hypothetical protein